MHHIIIEINILTFDHYGNIQLWTIDTIMIDVQAYQNIFVNIKLQLFHTFYHRIH
jgi:hypothetical protein